MAKEELSTELRLLLAFALSFLVIIMSRSLLVKPAPPAEQKTAAKQSTPAPPPPVVDATPQTPPETKGDLKQGTAEQQITVESDLYQVVFSSRGAVVKNWALKGYRDEQNNPLDLVDSGAA